MTLDVAERFADTLASAAVQAARTRFFALITGCLPLRGTEKSPTSQWFGFFDARHCISSAVYAFTVLENTCRLGEPWILGRPLHESGNARNEGSKQPSSATSSATPSAPSRSPRGAPSTAVALASRCTIRDFSAMPILADALQDAGCDNADILDHCRGPGPHVRGCWVVDLVLGKE